MTLVQLSGRDLETVGKKHHHGLHIHFPRIRVARLALAPTRAAFLLAVEFNVHGLATHLNSIYKKRPQVINNFWKTFGGDEHKFLRAIEKGATHHALLGSPSDYISEMQERIGIAPLAALAAATPILIAALNMFKGNKDAMDKEGGHSAINNTLDGISNAIQEGKAALNADERVTKSVENIPTDPTGKPYQGGILPPKKGSGFFEELNLTPMEMLIGAGVVGGLILLTRK